MSASALRMIDRMLLCFPTAIYVIHIESEQALLTRVAVPEKAECLCAVNIALLMIGLCSVPEKKLETLKIQAV